MSRNQINLDTVISRRDALLSNNLGNDVVMMDIEQGNYYGLEAVAARIWELTEQPVSVNSLCVNLMAEYDISPEKCREEVVEFLDDLLQHKIIQIVD